MLNTHGFLETCTGPDRKRRDPDSDRRLCCTTL